MKEPSVKRALDATPEDARKKAEAEAREVGERLGRSMETWAKFANAVRAELAALGVRMTATEEELTALIVKVRALEEKCRSKSDGGVK